VQEENKKF